MGSMGIPKVVRDALWPMIEDAILDSRDDETLEISVERAGELLRRRIFSSAEVRIAVLGDPNSIAPFIHDVAVPHFLSYQVSQRVEHMKLDLVARSEEGLNELGDLEGDCYTEVLSYRKQGRRTAVIKFVGDMTLTEVREVARQFNNKRIAAGKRETFADSLVARLEEAGAGENTTISAAIAEPVSV